MIVEVELRIYKSLVMQLVDEDDTLSRVIERLSQSVPGRTAPLPAPINQKNPGYWYKGKWHRSDNAIDVYLQFLETLDQHCENFCEKFSSACISLGNTRPYIAREKQVLYPSRPELRRFAKPLNDWWVDGNISNKQKLDLMHLAANTAGLQESVHYKINLPNGA